MDTPFTIKTDRPLCGKSAEEALSEIEKFHGHIAPGLVIGAFMVDFARELIGPDVEADAVVETRKCLPDAVQIFTPCTIGNGWLRVLDWNKFALSLYDKKTRFGYRVWLDIEKSKPYPNLYRWFMHLVSKKELPLDVLLESIFEAGRSALSFCPVRVTGFTADKCKREEIVCPTCGEAYYSEQGAKCLSCQGKGYYALARPEC